jgi:hypothetical protein
MDAHSTINLFNKMNQAKLEKQKEIESWLKDYGHITHGHLDWERLMPSSPVAPFPVSMRKESFSVQCLISLKEKMIYV